MSFVKAFGRYLIGMAVLLVIGIVALQVGSIWDWIIAKLGEPRAVVLLLACFAIAAFVAFARPRQRD